MHVRVCKNHERTSQAWRHEPATRERREEHCHDRIYARAQLRASRHFVQPEAAEEGRSGWLAEWRGPRGLSIDDKEWS